MPIENLTDLFLHTLKDILYAENQIKKALPKMIGKTSDGKLRGLFEDHLDETETQIGRLGKVFKSIGEEAVDEHCPAIVGIIDEAEQMMSEIDDAETRDAALIAAAQAVEHYEITRYGTLCVWAKRLGLTEAKNLLEKTLWEEEDVDERLTQIAESKINKSAAV